MALKAKKGQNVNFVRIRATRFIGCSLSHKVQLDAFNFTELVLVQAMKSPSVGIWSLSCDIFQIFVGNGQEKYCSMFQRLKNV